MTTNDKKAKEIKLPKLRIMLLATIISINETNKNGSKFKSNKQIA